MSTKRPLDSAECGACTTWLRCKIAALTCWAQSKVEFLCERDRSSLDEDETIVMLHHFEAFHRFAGLEVMSERCLKIDYESRADVAEWIQCVQDHGYTLPDMVLEIGKGKLTLPNKVGMAFSYGTTCKCCVAYRGMALGAVMLVSGMIIGAAL